MPPSSQLRVCVLASGSSGNCIHVESASTALLIDAGISARETSTGQANGIWALKR